MSRASQLPLLLMLLLVACFTMANQECAPTALEGDALLPQEQEDERLQGALRSAMANLATHDVRNANRDFGFALSLDGDHSQALLGEALTRLLLLPESAPITTLLQDLGEGPWLAQETLYGPQGLLQALTRTQEDEARCEQLYAALPWTRAHWEDPALILDAVAPELDGNHLALSLEALAWELEDIANQLHRGLDRPDFSPFVMPSTTFHGQTRWHLGSPELLTLEGALRLGSSALLWVTSYDWPHELADYGSDATAQQRLDAFHAHALRAVRPQNNLALARGQMARGLDNLRQALDSVPNSQPGALSLQKIDPETRQDLRDLLMALRMSMDEPMMLPDTEPQATLYLGALFEERTLSPEHGLLRLRSDQERGEQGRAPEDELEGGSGDSDLSPDYDGLRQLFFQGVLSPDCDLDPEAQDRCPGYKPSQGGLEEISADLFDPILGDLERDYTP